MPVESCFSQSQEFSAATGLPKDLDEIFSPAHVQEEEVRKTLADVMSFKELDFQEKPSTMQPSLHGARMLPLATMFAKDPNKNGTCKKKNNDFAPPLVSILAFPKFNELPVLLTATLEFSPISAAIVS